MRLGLIARADNSGLGVQTWEAYRALKPCKTLVINVGHLYDETEHANKRTYLDRYPDAMVCNGWEPNRLLLQQFCSDLDVVFSCETFYSDELPMIARQRGARTVLQPNFEFLRPWVAPDLWAAPSLWRFSEITDPKVHLPVPIATDRFTLRHHPDTAQHFVHVIGRPAVHDRNGSPDVLDALAFVRSDIVLTLRCQNAAYVDTLLKREIPSNVEIRVDTSDPRDYWSLFDEGDVLVLPRRYAGLCLPTNEALGAGLPVVMTDISPNNTWLPQEWLVPARHTATFHAFQRVDVFQANAKALGAKIDQFATDPEFYAKARDEAMRLRDELSWTNMIGRYEEVLGG